MKRIKYILLFLILLIPFNVFAETCDNSNIEIKTIVQASKSEGTEEKANPSIENNEINVDISMSEVNDYIEYNIDVENKSDEDLAFNGKSITSEDSHFKYTFTYENDSNIIPAHDDKIVSMKVTYVREIETSEFESGKYIYNETKKMGIMDPDLVNPKTSNTIYIVLFVVISAITVLGLTILKKKCMALLFLVFLIPYTVYAACSYEVEMNISIEVSNIPDPVAFSTDSWATIAKAAKTNNLSLYNVGDTKSIDLGTLGTHTVRIANKSTPTECSGEGFSETGCGFVLEFVDVVTTYEMNTYYKEGTQTHTNDGGWSLSSMREYVNGEFLDLFPTPLKRNIKETRVISGHGYNDAENYTTTDKVYLLASKEIGVTSDYDAANDACRILDYYNTHNDNTFRKKKNSNNTTQSWWLRGTNQYTTSDFRYVSENGNITGQLSKSSLGVSPAFRLG